MTSLLTLVPLLLLAIRNDADPRAGREALAAEPAVAAASGAARCAPAQPLAEADVDEVSQTLVIASGGQVALGAVRIGAGHIGEVDRAQPRQPSRKGLTAQLWIQLEGERRTYRHVHPGSAFAAGGRRFMVASIEPDAVRLVALPRRH